MSKAVDTKADELRGPWSDPPTDEVQCLPTSCRTQRQRHHRARRADMKVRFQVVRFHPADGVTVPRSFDARRERSSASRGRQIFPSPMARARKVKVIDFNSRQIVLDVVSNKKTGGYQHLPSGIIGPPIARPALALLLRPDGSVALHNEADDEANEVRRDIDANYITRSNSPARNVRAARGWARWDA